MRVVNDDIPAFVSHYRVGRLIGRGEMGSVYEGEDRRDGTRVAVKFLRRELSAADATFGERFEREARVAALLRSPYTVKLVDYGVEDGLPCLVMDYVEGQPLSALAGSRPLETSRALRIARDIARALEEADARGVVHRDIKPANVLIVDGDHVRVTDFGIARQLGDAGLALPGRYVGTATYAAPEQANGKADHRSDLYALGGTLFTMLTGKLPPHADLSRAAVELRGVPGEAVAIVLRCLQPEPELRYRSAREVAAAIGEALAHLQRGEGDGGTVEAPVRSIDPPTVLAPAAPAASPRAAPAASPRAAAMPAIRLSLEPEGWAEPRYSAFAYGLRIENRGATAAALALTGRGDAVAVEATGLVTVAAGGTVESRVVVRGDRRRWWGSLVRRRFAVTASAAGGGPPLAMAEAEFEDVPDPRGRVAMLGVGGVALAGILAAVLAVSGLFGGGDSKASPATATATETTTRQTTSATTSATASGGTASATGSAEATATAPPKAIVPGQWDYTFAIISNSCGGAPRPGDAPFRPSFYYDERSTPKDGYVSDGELVDVTQIGGDHIGNFVFSWPVFQFSYPIQGGEATLVNTFRTTTSGVAELTEAYFLSGGDTCSIYMKDQ